MFTSNSATNTNHAIDALATKSVRYVPLSSSVNQFTMRTIRTDRQCFGVYPLAPCAPFTDRETTFTIRQPIHHVHHPHGSSVFWGLPSGTMCTVYGSWNHPSTNSPSAQIVHMVYGSRNQWITITEPIHHLHNVVTKSTIRVVSWYCMDHTPKKVFLFDSV